MSSAKEARKHYKDREATELWIRLVNLRRPQTSLPEPAMLRPEGEHRKMLRQLYSAFREQFRVDCFPRKVFPEGMSILSHHQFESGEQLYPLFYNVRAALAAIVEAGAKKQPAAQISPTSSIVVTPLRGVKFMFPAPSTGTVAFIMPDGTLWFYQDPYRDFLAVIEGVEVTRLRRCPVCGRFFWAQREDKAACGARCANVYRVRRRREKQREYAANRRENRRVKKQRAKGRIFK